jgi:hypothetical protein
MKIIGYFRYVDDIFILNNHKKTNAGETLVKLNKQPI